MDAEDLVFELLQDINTNKPGGKIPKSYHRLLVQICEGVMEKIPTEEKDEIKFAVMTIFKEITSFISYAMKNKGKCTCPSCTRAAERSYENPNVKSENIGPDFSLS